MLRMPFQPKKRICTFLQMERTSCGLLTNQACQVNENTSLFMQSRPLHPQQLQCCIGVPIAVQPKHAWQHTKLPWPHVRDTLTCREITDMRTPHDWYRRGPVQWLHAAFRVHTKARPQAIGFDREAKLQDCSSEPHMQRHRIVSSPTSTQAMRKCCIPNSSCRSLCLGQAAPPNARFY